MVMIATVIRQNPGSLLVRDAQTNQDILVVFRGTQRFATGDRVRITFSGAMTPSIPPRITATSIERIQAPPPPPAPTPPPPPVQKEIRAVVVQRRRNSLVVMDANNRRLTVHYEFAYHFCVGQRIIIRHSSIVAGRPIEVNATDIRPVC